MKKIIIGLTGGHASGKSTVLKAFKALGAKTLDSDQIARALVQKGRPELKRIRKVFGPHALKTNGTLDRAWMRRRIIQSPKLKKKLEGILHPRVAQALKEEIRRSSKELVVVDIPLLFEAGFKKLVDRTLVVWAPPGTQLKRLMHRDGLSKSEAQSWIKAQWPLGRKKKMADHVIDNSKSNALTKKQVARLFSALTRTLAGALLLCILAAGRVLAAEQDAGLKQAIELANQNRHADAAAILEKLSARFPQDDRIWLSLGLSYKELNQTDKALNALEKASAIKPSGEGWYVLGHLYEAKAFRTPDNPAPWLYKARLAWNGSLTLQPTDNRKVDVAQKHLKRIDQQLGETR